MSVNLTNIVKYFSQTIYMVKQLVESIHLSGFK